MDFNNYTPIITKYQISDIDGYQGQDNLIYSRGEVNIDYEVEDFKVNSNQKTNTQTSQIYTSEKTYNKDDEYIK